MPQSLMVYNTPTFVVADTEAGLTTGTAFECQITRARIDPTITFATVPSTGCTGPSQSPSAAAWTLHIEWLEDWVAALGGLSGWAYDNRLQRRFFKLVPNVNDTTVEVSGECWVVPGGIGWTFGNGEPALSTADWQMIGDPDFTYPITVMAADADETDETVAA